MSDTADRTCCKEEERRKEKREERLELNKETK